MDSSVLFVLLEWKNKRPRDVVAIFVMTQVVITQVIMAQVVMTQVVMTQVMKHLKGRS